MKHLFALIGVTLLLASAAIYASYPDLQSDVPVIYWVTDPNPARERQVATFHQWLVDNGHVTADGQPMAELRLDTGSSDIGKKIIQGVSGVGGDVMDVGSAHLAYLAEIGILADVTDVARELGFSTDKTYASVGSEITVDGRQYGFPCNVTAHMLWVNKATFETYGQPTPPHRWTLDEFEQRGKAFVEVANEPGQRQTVFFANNIPVTIMSRSLGLGNFNETLTRSTLDDSRFAEVLARKYKWIYEDRILPSAQEQEGFDTAGGYGGATLQLFNRGNYGMFMMGRYALIQLRAFGNLAMDVVEPPNGGFPNTSTSARTATVYVGSPHPDVAHLFLAFLASEAYNELIVDDADALPPNPVYTESEAFKRPPLYPNEWGLHEKFADAANHITIAGEYSPFIPNSAVGRLIRQAEEAVMNDQMTPKQAANWLARTINGQIARNLQRTPSLQTRYEQLLARQEQIEALRAAGEPVPAELIENPFHRKYYAAQGWLAALTE